MTNITNQTNTNESVLKTVRSLMPLRVLSYGEALRLAELQANCLLSLHQVSTPAVPIEIITEQPRIRVAQSFDLPASGSAHWDGNYWVITLNAAEYKLRQRFSIMHEYKHIVDHPTRHLIQGDRRLNLTAEEQAEKIADYFAACVLMRKSWVKRSFFSETQSIEKLAARFQVSPRAMSFRLHQLGIVDNTPRCESRTISPTRSAMKSRRRDTYQRALANSSPLTGVLT